MDHYYRTYNANIHRGVYAIAEEATAAYEDARAQGRAVRRRAARAEIVFTRSSTEAINLVAYAWGRTNVGAGDAILLTEMEHHSNLVPWQILADGARRGDPLHPGRRDAGELDLSAARPAARGPR